MNEAIIKSIRESDTTGLYKASWRYRDDAIIKGMIDEELKQRGNF